MIRNFLCLAIGAACGIAMLLAWPINAVGLVSLCGVAFALVARDLRKPPVVDITPQLPLAQLHRPTAWRRQTLQRVVFGKPTRIEVR